LRRSGRAAASALPRGPHTTAAVAWGAIAVRFRGPPAQRTAALECRYARRGALHTVADIHPLRGAEIGRSPSETSELHLRAHAALPHRLGLLELLLGLLCASAI